MRWRPGIHKPQESGQAVIEYILISPILLILLAGVFQLALICEANLITHMAVRHAAEIYLQGGKRLTIQKEISEYFDQYPFMEGQTVLVLLIESPLMTTLKVICKPPVVPFVELVGEVPAVTASMSLGEEVFDLSRIPGLQDLRQFGEFLQGGK
ncbi:MAG: hypothetical protein GX977_13795 [Firmicutes bacterium]|nr:hypothetical protein [Bacillota bacterium]